MKASAFHEPILQMSHSLTSLPPPSQQEKKGKVTRSLHHLSSRRKKNDARFLARHFFIAKWQYICLPEVISTYPWIDRTTLHCSQAALQIIQSYPGARIKGIIGEVFPIRIRCKVLLHIRRLLSNEISKFIPKLFDKKKRHFLPFEMFPLANKKESTKIPYYFASK